MSHPSATGPPIPELIGGSPAMVAVYDTIRRVARSHASVLLLGESGTGKELVAHAIHRLSRRSSGPFVRVNCGALSENLLESELFGHVRGAFTGAVANRTGRFEAGHGGTVFLDEINSTSVHLQVKLLRVLQEREFERVGDTQTVRVDTRVIAASNRDLTSEVAADRFREDLYWRLNVVPIVLPPLRDRLEDVPALVAHFLAYYNEANDREVTGVAPDAMARLQRYQWPGNVRELQNYVERAVVMADGETLTVDVLPAHLGDRSVDHAPFSSVPSGRSVAHGSHGTDEEAWSALIERVVGQGLQRAGETENDLHALLVGPMEQELIRQVMELCGQVQTKAAHRLGMNRNTLHKKLKQYGFEPE